MNIKNTPEQTIKWKNKLNFEQINKINKGKIGR